MIFFALALSWVKETSEFKMPDFLDIQLKLFRKKNKAGKFEHHLVLNGFNWLKNFKIPLTPSRFNLILSFAEKKLNDVEDWLEIKPKNAPNPNKSYPINDHNEIGRLLNTIIDFLENNTEQQIPTKSQLRHLLFEMSDKRDRKIRLRVSKSNILLDLD